jgi:hypothetical protein
VFLTLLPQVKRHGEAVDLRLQFTQAIVEIRNRLIDGHLNANDTQRDTRGYSRIGLRPSSPQNDRLMPS